MAEGRHSHGRTASVAYLEMKTVPEFTINVPGFEIVRPSKGEAVIEQESPVSDVQRLNRN